jgi:hypothetical protein
MRMISDHGLHGWTRIDTKVDRVLPNAMSAGRAIALGTRRSTRFNASLARRSLGEGGNAATSAKPQTISPSDRNNGRPESAQQMSWIATGMARQAIKKQERKTIK